MSQIRARLAALRAKREQSLPTTESKLDDKKASRTNVAHDAAHTRFEWRARARQAATDRFRRATLESGVYDVITRPLPKEKDDIAELEKRKEEEEKAGLDEDNDEDENQDEDEDEQEGQDGEEEEDEEEAALERLGKGILSDCDTRDGNAGDDDTRDADTRDADTRDTQHDGDTTRHTNEVSTFPDAEALPQCGPTDEDKEDHRNEEITAMDHRKETAKDQDGLTNADDKHLMEPENKPSIPVRKFTVPISETGPEEQASPSESQEDIAPQKATPREVTPPEVTPPRNLLGMIEDEAEDDENDEDRDNGSPDLSGDEINDIVPDADVSQADAVKLAEFHRKWEAEQMQPTAPTCDDLDDAMDFSVVKTVGEDSVCAEGDDKTGTDHADNYIDAMFLRDDSKSKVIEVEDEEEASEETMREKARALWKARRKFQMQLRERDESNSLSRFDLFNDSQNRSADIRSRLEKSCRPAPFRDVTNIDKNKKRKLEPSEWTRRKEILAQKDRKRRRAVSVGNWSFAMHGKREEVNVKKTSARPTLGAAHLTKRSRSRKAATPPKTRPTVAARPRKRTDATSFKGLLSVLGRQASVDPTR